MGRPRVLCRAIAVCPTAGGGKLSFVMLLASLLIIPVAYLLGSIPVAFVTRWAFLCWILIPLVNRVVRAVTRRVRGSGSVPAAAAR